MILNEHRMFGDIFKELRLENNLSQDKLAEELDVSQGLLTKWENHISTPSPEMLDYIADYFKVSTDYLIGRSKMKNNPMENMNPIEQYKILFDKDNKLTNNQKDFLINFLEEQHNKIDENVFNDK